MMARLLFSIILFFYLYAFSLAVLPILSTRIILGLIGFIYIVFNLYQNLSQGKLLINRRVLYVSLALILIFSVSFFSIIYNKTNDYEFIKFSLSMFIGFLSATSIYKIAGYLGIRKDEYTLITCLIIAILLQCSISLAMYFSPYISDTINSVIHMSELSIIKQEALQGLRIIGFSRSYFSAGIYCGMGLLLIAYLIRYYTQDRKQILLLVISYIFIFIVGMMMARTTLIGMAFSILLLIAPTSIRNLIHPSKRKLKFLTLLIAIPMMIVHIFLLFFPSFLQKIDPLIQFAFELFFNLIQENSLETRSTNSMLNMYKFPDNLKTWLIGDAMWSLDGGTEYYMHTDIGYSRLLFYFGVLGLVIFIGYQLVLIKMSLNKKLALILLSLYFLILNLKGFADLSNFLILILIFRIHAEKVNFIQQK